MSKSKQAFADLWIKTCSQCKHTYTNLEIEMSFSKNKRRPDGLQDVCKECFRKRYLRKTGKSMRVPRQYLEEPGESSRLWES